jgi:hypothetical protein
MENINKNGEIKQPINYNDFGTPSYNVEELYEDDIYIHIKGYVGYLDTNLEIIKSDELTFQLSNYDGIQFYLKYNKKTNKIEIDSGFRTTTCTTEEFEKFKNTWYYNKEIENFNTGEHFPYFRLPRSKDCILIPHFIKTLWKGDNLPIIFLKINNEE